MKKEFLIDINPDIELPEYNLELHKLTEEPIMPLKNIINLQYKPYYVGIDELEFDIPLYRNEHDGTKVKNEIYDLVDGEYLILLNQMKYFIIDSIKEESDDESGKVWKSVHAYSREYELSHKKLVDYKADSRVLYDDSNSMFEGLEKGILNYVFNHVTKSWTIGYVDPDVIIKGNEGVYRALDFPNTNLLQVFQELQKTYNCIFNFNTLEQTIDIYDINKKLGQDRGLYISDYNFLKKLTKKVNYDDIKTRLYIYGKDNISIQSISPTGQPYLDSFSAYKTTKHMTQGLIDALNTYEEKVSNYNPDFEPLLQQLQEANVVMEGLYNADHIDDLNQKGLIALQRKLSQIQTMIDVKIEELAIIQNTINNATGTELSDLYNDKKAVQTSIDSLNTEKDNINTLITNKQIEIDNQQQIIDDIKQQIHDLQYVLDVNNPNNFTEEQIKELDRFVRIETYNDSNYTENNITELYEEGKKLLARISQPKIQFDADVIDFLNVVECQHIWDKFVLGDIVRLEHSELGFNYEVRLVGYEHDVDSNNLNLKFSNTNTYDDTTLYMSELLEQMHTTSTAVDFNKDKWDKTDDIESQIAKYVDVKLEQAKQNILNAVGQRYLFGDDGLWLYKENPDGTINPEQIRAINNTIALTKDNWNTVSTAVTPNGLVAEKIYGKIVEGAQVSANCIIVGENGETISDDALGGNLLKQNFYYNRTKITEQEGVEVYDNLGRKVLQMGGFDSTGGNGVKDKYGHVAYHYNADGTPNGHSALVGEGFLRKYPYGEARYLNDIYAEEFLDNREDLLEPPLPVTIPLPSSFRGRENQIKILLIPSRIAFFVGHIWVNGTLDNLSSGVHSVLQVVESNFNIQEPYLKVNAYTKNPYRQIEYGGSSSYSIIDNEYYCGLSFVLVIIGY